jgi:hypothetical protein
MLRELERDVTILMERSLLNKELACFGIDGNGEYGQHDLARTYQIDELDVLMASHPDAEWPDCCVCIHLTGYNSNDVGHIMTDRNAEISINSLLTEQHIIPGCWSWDEPHNQGTHSICIVIDVRKLLLGG